MGAREFQTSFWESKGRQHLALVFPELLKEATDHLHAAIITRPLSHQP